MNRPCIQRIFLIQFLFIIYISLTVSPSLHAQNADRQLSFNIRNATFQDFIKLLENSTGFSFIYGEEVKVNKKITLNISKKTLKEILDIVFADEPIDYQIIGKYISLQPKKIKPVSRRFTISGYVTDGASSETLIGANILESRQHQGTATNPYGFYSITLPAGEADLRFSYLGFDTQQHTFALQRDTVLNVRLATNTQLSEVVILSDKPEAGMRATQMGANVIPMAQIRHTPSVLGEADVMKTIQLMPGVQAGVEGSAGLYVRGGGPDQNLILLDGVPLYNVDHLFGFFSVFTPEAIKKVTLFKSSFPARFGGRLSSVVDVRSNDGDMKRFHGTFSLGLLSAKMQLEGPIIKDRTSFNISARRSYIDVIAKPFMPKDEKMSYFFYDINAKINHKFSDRSRLYLNFYNGKDHYHFTSEWPQSHSVYENQYKDKMSIDWGNTVVSGRWNYIFNNKLFSNTTVAYNNYLMGARTETYSKNVYGEAELDKESKYDANFRSGINDWSYAIDFDYTPLPTHRIRFGGNYLFHRFRPEVMTSKIYEQASGSVQQDTAFHSLFNQYIYAHEASVYAEDDFELTPRLQVNAGLHVSLFNVQKKTYFSVQPRLSARYQLPKHFALKASYSKMSQYIHLLSSTPISMPTDLWVPVTSKIKPMQAHQYSVGAYYNGLPGWEFSVESYYKQMRNVLEYKEGVSFLGSSTNWEDKVEMGKGRSMGIEFMAQKTTGKTTGWIAYTLARSDRQFAKGSINNGERFPYKYDRRHNVSISLNHAFSDRIDVGATWVFYTGGTATLPVGVTGVLRPDGDEVKEEQHVTQRNNYRLPASHRLNLGINFNKKTRHGVRTWNISVYNAYNAMNPSFLLYKDNGKKMKKLTLLPCIPSVTYTYKF